MGSSVILPQTGQPPEGPDPNFQVAAVPNIVTFAYQELAPPTGVYIQRDDKLSVKILNSFVGMGFIVSLRLLMPIGPLPGQPDAKASDESVKQQQARGWVNIIQKEFFPTSDRVQNPFSLDLAEGYLLSVSVAYDFTLGQVSRGQAFISIGLQRNAPSPGRFIQLISDSIGFQMDLAWPGGTIRAATEGPGFIHSITIANPAAGSDWSFTIPVNARMRFSAGAATLTTSAQVAARAPGFHQTDGVNEYFFATAAQTQAASTTVRYNYLPGGSSVPLVGTQTSVTLPSVDVLPPGHVLGSATGVIQTGDQYSGIAFCVEEWINA